MLQAKRIKVKCSDTVYHNSFYVLRDGDADRIHCKVATSNAEVDLESAGVLSDAQGWPSLSKVLAPPKSWQRCSIRLEVSDSNTKRSRGTSQRKSGKVP
jgi:hypothetical protein